eukprot:14783071-Alexandrium_andersonii.AAC.1
MAASLPSRRGAPLRKSLRWGENFGQVERVLGQWTAGRGEPRPNVDGSWSNHVPPVSETAGVGKWLGLN